MVSKQGSQRVYNNLSSAARPRSRTLNIQTGFSDLSRHLTANSILSANMIKRRLAEEVQLPDPPKRKRVAFTTPKAATKAMYVCPVAGLLCMMMLTRGASIERNAKVSPLWKLPSELRDKIWIEVLGGRLIHLDFDEDRDTSDSELFSESDRPHFKHRVCQHDCKEDRSDRKAPRPHFECRFREEELYFDLFGDDPEPGYDADATLHLTVLRASRQLYVEANRVLWTTNTFSFSDGLTFGEFMKTRNLHQKRLIRTLRFEMQWGLGHERLWNSALGMALVKSLTGLQTLRLQIVCDVEKERWDHNQDRFVRLTTYTEGLRKLSILPLTSVEIAVRASERGNLKHNPFAMPGSYGSSELWQKGDRDRCAQDLKALLLDPEGAQVYGDFKSSTARTRAELEQLRACTVAWKPWLVMP